MSRARVLMAGRARGRREKRLSECRFIFLIKTTRALALTTCAAQTTLRDRDSLLSPSTPLSVRDKTEFLHTIYRARANCVIIGNRAQHARANCTRKLLTFFASVPS